MKLKEFNKRIVTLRPELLSIAKAMTHEEQDAEDAVQETLLRLWTKRDNLDSHPNVRALAIAALKNVVRDNWRKQQRDLTDKAQRCGTGTL